MNADAVCAHCRKTRLAWQFHKDQKVCISCVQEYNKKKSKKQNNPARIKRYLDKLARDLG